MLEADNRRSNDINQLKSIKTGNIKLSVKYHRPVPAYVKQNLANKDCTF